MSTWSVGTVDDLVETAFSGFTYPSRKRQLNLLGTDAAPTGNVVLQESAKGYRQATLVVLVESDDDFETLRGYDETSETVTLGDDLGLSRDVYVLSFGAAKRPAGELWDVTLVLVETSAPV